MKLNKTKKINSASTTMGNLAIVFACFGSPIAIILAIIGLCLPNPNVKRNVNSFGVLIFVYLLFFIIGFMYGIFQ